MHPDERPIPESLVRSLLADSYPEWADLTLARVASAGTDNALYRLGADLVVRLPRIGWAVDAIGHEYEWIPKLAPHLPFATPEPLALGRPAAGYPWPWAVYRWLEGTNPITGQVAHGVAEDIAKLITALRAIRIANPPASSRGTPLATRDAMTREAIAASGDRIDAKAVTEVWQKALALPPWEAEPVWVHADLTPGNLLVRDGKLSAVIDFSMAGVGDPATDLGVAWNLLPAPARDTFREALGDDDATWLRGQALALSIALVQLPYYWDSNPPLAENSRHVIGEVLASRA